MTSTFRHIWNGDIAFTDSTNKSQVIAAIHYKRFLEIMVSILSLTAPFGYLVPAFDWSKTPFIEELRAMFMRVNLGAEVGDVTEHSWIGPWEKAQAAPWSIDISKMTSTLKYPGEVQSALTTFDTDWEDFLRINGFTPVSCIISGPPKSGKTSLAKSLSEKYVLSFLSFFFVKIFGSLFI
jgi:hypothetical protein